MATLGDKTWKPTTKKMSRHVLPLCLVVTLLLLFSSASYTQDSYILSRADEASTSSRSSVRQYSRESMSMTEQYHSPQLRRRAVSEGDPNANNGPSFLGGNLVESFQQALNDNAAAAATPEKRMLVYTGDMLLTTAKGHMAELTSQIEALIQKVDGYMEHQSSREDGSRYYQEHARQNNLIVSMTLRVPSDQFYPVVSQLKALPDAKVTDASTRSEDVTESFVDATSRAATLQASQTALQGLLSHAKSVQDVLEVQRELNRVTQDYESQKSKANALAKQSSLSTLHVTLQEKEFNVDEDLLMMAPIRVFRQAQTDVLTGFTVMTSCLVYVLVLAVSVVIPASR